MTLTFAYTSAWAMEVRILWNGPRWSDQRWQYLHQL